MPKRILGVVGPSDLVDHVSAIVDDSTSASAIPLAYQHERETLDIILQNSARVDGWLFTGVIPYHLATRAGRLEHPAAYVTNGRLGLLSALVRIAADHGGIPHLSVDTIAEAEVVASLADTGIPFSGVSVLPFADAVTSADFVEFHRAVIRAHPDAIALTCVRSVYEELSGDIAVVRLRPAVSDIQQATDMLALSIDGERNRDQMAVVGLLELPQDDPDVSVELAALAGEVVSTAPGRYLILTTRGPFDEATAGMTSAAFLAGLAARHEEVRVGFGLAGSVPEASARAARAVNRARQLDPHSAVIATRGGDEILLALGKDAQPVAPTLQTLQLRTGIRRDTLAQIKDLAATRGGILTSSSLAADLGLVERSARRILAKLERGGGVISRTSGSDGSIGRPRTEYQLRY